MSAPTCVARKMVAWPSCAVCTHEETEWNVLERDRERERERQQKTDNQTYILKISTAIKICIQAVPIYSTAKKQSAIRIDDVIYLGSVAPTAAPLQKSVVYCAMLC